MRNTIDGGTDEKIVWGILRLLFLAIGVLMAVHGIFLDKPCNGIDDEFLNCVLTGSLGDIVGMCLFIGGAVWISGIFRGFSRLGEAVKGSGVNFAVFGIMILGAILFWFT